jgi:hypothetical protein
MHFAIAVFLVTLQPGNPVDQGAVSHAATRVRAAARVCAVKSSCCGHQAESFPGLETNL